MPDLNTAFKDFVEADNKLFERWKAVVDYNLCLLMEKRSKALSVLMSEFSKGLEASVAEPSAPVEKEKRGPGRPPKQEMDKE